MSEWEEISLENITISLNTGLDAIKKAPIVPQYTGIKCLRIQDISNNKSFEKWGNTEVKEADYERFRLRKNDIIMARTCSTGISFLVKNDLNAVFNNGLARLRLNLKIADPVFIFYIFKSQQFKGYIDGISGGTSVQLNMKVGDLAKFQFLLPSLPEQKSIAAILSALDDKIELNRRMNETLEAMARAIFKDWFVDFGPTRAKIEGRAPYLPEPIWSLFPDAIDEETGLPEGWMERTLGEVSTKITKGTTPRKADYLPVFNLDKLVNFLRVNAISDNGSIIWDKLEKIPESVHLGSLKRSILEKNDILYTIAGTIGRVAIIDEAILPANTNQAIAIIRPDSETIPHLFLYLLISDESFQEKLHSKIVHAVQANLSLSVLSGTYVIFPPQEIRFGLFAFVENLLLKIQHNNHESRTLAELRDALLPKLMSGEIRVKDAERLVEEVL